MGWFVPPCHLRVILNNPQCGTQCLCIACCPADRRGSFTVLLFLLLPQGTLSHMSPELLLQGHASRASDVYAFGILLVGSGGGEGK